jgi:kynureninase
LFLLMGPPSFLCSGPGSIAGIFVHERHADNHASLPRMSGWWGQDPSVRFQMLPEHQPARGALSFQLSNPAVLPVICLRASLELFHEAGMPRLRAKSRLLTAYLELLLRRRVGAAHLRILTPSDPSQRGCQLSLSFAQPVERVHAALEAAGIICDIRRPCVMRIAPTPLYNSFQDVRRFVSLLDQALNAL